MNAAGCLKVGIVGCGVAGQTAAAFLADAGHRVNVFERFAEPQPLGAGLLLQPTGLAVLRALGLGEQVERLGARIDGLLGVNHLKHVVLDLAYADLHRAAYGLGIHRGALFSLLHDRLRRSTAGLITDAEVVDIVRDGARATVIDKAGRRHGPFARRGDRRGAFAAARSTHTPGTGAALSLGLHLGDCARLPGLRHGPRAAAAARPWDDDHDGAASDRTEFGPPVLEPAGCRAGSRATDRYRYLAIGGADALAGGSGADRTGWRGWRFRPRHLSARGTAALERGAGSVHWRCDARHQPPARPGRQSRAARRPRLVAGAGHEQRPCRGTGIVRAMARAVCPLLSPGQPSVDAFFQSHLPLLGLARDVLMGPRAACRAPGLRGTMTTTLAGLRRGWLSSDTLDAEGRYPLDS